MIHEPAYRRLSAPIGAVWVCSVAAVQVIAWYHDGTPGRAGSAPSAWPGSTTLPRATDRPRLLMFVRDDCPCSFAGVSELTRLLDSLPIENRPAGTVVFVGPDSDPLLWNRVGEVPELQRRRDPVGDLARAFQARTSGHVLLYDASGRLLFEGGLTVARGHEGESQARTSLHDQLVGKPAPSLSRGAPTFGCDLIVDELSQAD